jgi:amidohydrolase
MQSKTKQEIINEALGEFLHVMMWRRNLHQHPELSFEEHRTSKFIAEALRHDGIEYRGIAGTGILARIEGKANIGGKEREAVVLRADIDALPLTEASGVEFSSLNKGVMHACGHDMHTAILLGALRILNLHREQFAGTVFGLFQPGEELNPGGASMVMSEDPFADHDVVAFVGEHVEPLMRTGTFGFRKGKYMASSDELRFTIHGTGGHAAMRDKVKDPVQAAARLINELHAINAEHAGKDQPTILSIGKVVADGATNIVPDEVYMEGTMRTFDERWRTELKGILREKADKIGGDLGVTIDVDISDGYPSVYNDEALTARVVAATRALFGDDTVTELGLRPTAEDFGYYTQRYPSVYYRLGVGGHGEFFEKREAGRIHSPAFRPDEKALGYGVVQFVNIVFTMLGE